MGLIFQLPLLGHYETDPFKTPSRQIIFFRCGFHICQLLSPNIKLCITKCWPKEFHKYRQEIFILSLRMLSFSMLLSGTSYFWDFSTPIMFKIHTEFKINLRLTKLMIRSPTFTFCDIQGIFLAWRFCDIPHYYVWREIEWWWDDVCITILWI